MARTLEDAFKALAKWYESPSVGCFLVHKSPQKTLELWEESVVKLHEMSLEEREFFLKYMNDWKAFKAEVVARKDGPADRVKITRII